MTADDIKALVEGFRDPKAFVFQGPMHILQARRGAMEALEGLLSQVETLTLENQRLRVDSERLDWVMHRLSGKALRDIGVIYSDGSPAATRIAIDAARAQTDKEKPC